MRKSKELLEAAEYAEKTMKNALGKAICEFPKGTKCGKFIHRMIEITDDDSTIDRGLLNLGMEVFFAANICVKHEEI